MSAGSLPVAFLAEASRDIGTGHVVETLQLAERCSAFGLEPYVWLNKATPENLAHRISGSVRILPDVGEEALKTFVTEVQAGAIQAVVTNFRSITSGQIEALKRVDAPLLCIDELGGRSLDADVIFNNSIVPTYHHYPDTRARVYVGPDYMCMDFGYRRLGRVFRPFEGGIKNLLVSMGGSNPSRSTLRVVEALTGWRPDLKKHVVAGPGFDFVDRLAEKIHRAGTEFFLHRSPLSLVTLLSDVEVGITVGGNTLYEMACLGTPGMVLYEAPHEQEQGDAFASRGFGTCLGSGTEVPLEAIVEGLEALDSKAVLRDQSVRGRKLVDGLGTDRILEVVKEGICRWKSC